MSIDLTRRAWAEHPGATTPQARARSQRAADVAREGVPGVRFPKGHDFMPPGHSWTEPVKANPEQPTTLSDLVTFRPSAPTADQRRRAGVAPAIRSMKGTERLTTDALLVLHSIYLRAKASGTDGAMVTRGEVAYDAGITPDEAERLIDALEARGHIFASRAFGRRPIYKINFS
jgi:hypothetical protein